MAKKRKIKLPPSRNVPDIKKSDIVILPSVENLLDDALSTVGHELARLRAQSTKGYGLEAPQARILQGYIKALVDLSREARERQDGLEDISDNDILEHYLEELPREDVVGILQKIIRKEHEEREQEPGEKEQESKDEEGK